MTDEIAAAVVRFKEERESFQRAAKVIQKRVQNIADEAQIKCQVSSRAKDVRSFHKKLLVNHYPDPWAGVTDKAGVRAVVQVPADVDRLSQELDIAFGDKMVYFNDKRQGSEPDHLAYSGVHMQVIASGARAPTEIQCEIQLRTTAQDAWSVISHQLLYKPTLSLPKEMQRAAYRLVALVEIFDAEVGRIMESMTSLPGHGVIDLVEMAEVRFLSLAHSPSNSQLSVLVLDAIEKSITPTDRRQYSDLLDSFIAEHDLQLRALYNEYGTHGALSSEPDYVLFGQAESLIILERLTRRPHKLFARWLASDLPLSYLEALAGAAGISLPTS